jgi:hypothetical protein
MQLESINWLERNGQASPEINNPLAMILSGWMERLLEEI